MFVRLLHTPSHLGAFSCRFKRHIRHATTTSAGDFSFAFTGFSALFAPSDSRWRVCGVFAAATAFYVTSAVFATQWLVLVRCGSFFAAAWHTPFQFGLYARSASPADGRRPSLRTPHCRICVTPFTPGVLVTCPYLCGLLFAILYSSKIFPKHDAQTPAGLFSRWPLPRPISAVTCLPRLRLPPRICCAGHPLFTWFNT